MKYRPEIDGLRALAVLPVILFHAQEHYLPGGFLGVDIFFVISGFLITRIIQTELDNRQFSLARFYERRIRRILPALFTVILCSLPLAWLTLYSVATMKEFGNSVVASLLFLANFFYLDQMGDYFSPDASMQPLLHLWSLAVEEQFYLFFPWLLIILSKYSRRRKLIALGGLTTASLLLNVLLASSHPGFSFYMLPTRFWQLSAGAMLALAALPSCTTVTSVRQILSASGLGLIALAYTNWLETLGFFASGSIMAVLGAVLIIGCAAPGTWVYRLLSSKLLVGVGLISYSLYLWHQPVFAFARLHDAPDALSAGYYAGLMTVIVLLAVATWKFVEQPCRRKFGGGGGVPALA